MLTIYVNFFQNTLAQTSVDTLHSQVKNTISKEVSISKAPFTTFLNKTICVTVTKGPSINYVILVGERGVASKMIYPMNLIKRKWGGQNFPILRQHSLWTVPNG